MTSILVIGTGAAGSVVVKKICRLPHVFSEIHLASRTLSKCEQLKKEFSNIYSIHELDADIIDDVVKVITKTQVKIVINMALPYQDLSIMDACLKTGVHYIDTANYEPKDEAKFSYSWQWAYQDRFKEAGLMALLGSGFDPGVTNVFCAYAKKHFFDHINTIDIVDCNAGDHGHPFATNFNPEINIREITQKGRFYEDGKWIEVDAMSVSEDIDFPEVGVKRGYLLFHEEMESLVKHIPELQRIRFWMTFSEAYLTHLDVLQNVGMTRIDPVTFQGQEIIPLQFLKALLPEPSSLGENYEGKTCIGCIITGKKEGQNKKIMIYNVCDHQDAYRDVQAQAVSYTTGVPAMIGAKLLATGVWKGEGVYNMEQMDPDPFMTDLNEFGLPWKVKEFSDV